jgi:hypothetical protein
MTLYGIAILSIPMAATVPKSASGSGWREIMIAILGKLMTIFKCSGFNGHIVDLRYAMDLWMSW